MWEFKAKVATVSVTNVVTRKQICPLTPVNVEVMLMLMVGVQKATGTRNIEGGAEERYVS